MPIVISKRFIRVQSLGATAIRVSAVGAICSVGFSTALTSIFCGLILILWISTGQMISQFKVYFAHPVSRAVLLFFIVLIFGCGIGDVAIDARLDSLWSWRKLVFIVILIPLFSEVAWKDRFIEYFFLSCCVGLAISFFSYFGIIKFNIDDVPGVVLQNWATQGMIFSVATLVAFSLQSQAKKGSQILLILLGIVFIINIIYVTPGRSGYVALFVTLLTIGLIKFGVRWLPITIVALSLLAGLAYFNSPTMKSKIERSWIMADIYSSNDEPPLNSETFRIMAYTNTWEVIKQRPIFGGGTGGFPVVFNKHVRDKYSDWRAEKISDPHNQYLFILAENGFLGFVFFLGFLVSPILVASSRNYHYQIGTGILLIWSITSLFSSHFRTFPEGHFVALFLGVMFSMPFDRDLKRISG